MIEVRNLTKAYNVLENLQSRMFLFVQDRERLPFF